MPILMSILLGLFAVLSIWVWNQETDRSQPGDVGAIHRLLYPVHYRAPALKCPVCGCPHPSTAIVCRSDNHPPEEPRDLRAAPGGRPGRGLFLTAKGRIWGLAILISLMLMSILWIARPWALYTTLALAIVWLVMPMMACYPSGRNVFVGCASGILAAIGVLSYGLPPRAGTWLASQGHLVAFTLTVGPVRMPVDTGVTPHGALALNGLCLGAALLGVAAGVRSYRDSPGDFRGGLIVGLVGWGIAAFALLALSEWQGLGRLVFVYRAALIVALGLVVAAFVRRAMVRSVPRIRQFSVDPLIPEPADPGTLLMWHDLSSAPRPPAGRGYGAAMDQILYSLMDAPRRTANAAGRAAFELGNAVIGAATLVFRTVVRLVNWILEQLVLSAVYLRYVGEEFVALVRARSFGTLYRHATVGFRLTLMAPTLMVIASLLLTAAVRFGFAYLRAGALTSWAVLLLVAVLASASVAWAAAFYVGWDLVGSLLSVASEYLGWGLVLFAIYLDGYGIERRVLGLPSHFGLIAWLLNAVVVGAVVIPAYRHRQQAKAEVGDEQESAHLPSGEHRRA